MLRPQARLRLPPGADRVDPQRGAGYTARAAALRRIWPPPSPWEPSMVTSGFVRGWGGGGRGGGARPSFFLKVEVAKRKAGSIAKRIKQCALVFASRLKTSDKLSSC